MFVPITNSKVFFFLPALTSLTSAGLLKIFECNSTTWWTAVNLNMGLIFLFWSFQPSSRWSLSPLLADIPIFSILLSVFPWSYFMLRLGHLCILRLLQYIQVPFLRWAPPSAVCREWWNLPCPRHGAFPQQWQLIAVTLTPHVCASVCRLGHAWRFKFVTPRGQELSAPFCHSTWPGVQKQASPVLHEEKTLWCKLDSKTTQNNLFFCFLVFKLFQHTQFISSPFLYFWPTICKVK